MSFSLLSASAVDLPSLSLGYGRVSCGTIIVQEFPQ